MSCTEKIGSCPQGHKQDGEGMGEGQIKTYKSFLLFLSCSILLVFSLLLTFDCSRVLAKLILTVSVWCLDVFVEVRHFELSTWYLYQKKFLKILKTQTKPKQEVQC